MARLFRSYSFVGFWLVTEYAKGMCVVYELVIEEWYANLLKLKMAQHCLPINNHDSYTYLSALLHLVYFARIKMVVLLSIPC